MYRYNYAQLCFTNLFYIRLDYFIGMKREIVIMFICLSYVPAMPHLLLFIFRNNDHLKVKQVQQLLS